MAFIKAPMRKLSEKFISIASRSLLESNRVPKCIATYLSIYGIKADARTMVSVRRLRNLHKVSSDRSLPDGSFVECGVARGGCITLMSLVSRGKRAVWGFDSFRGMPPLTTEDEGDGQEHVGMKCSGELGIEEAQRTLRRFHAEGDWVRLVPGYFEDTLQEHAVKVAPIAVLRLDNDWYRSTRYCLECLYDEVVANGIVIIDDYYTFKGCRTAVDEFRAQRNIQSPLITTESKTEVCWYKTE